LASFVIEFVADEAEREALQKHLMGECGW